MVKVQVLIVDDHPLVLESIEQLLKTEKNIEVVGKANSAGEAVAQATALKPDVVIMDFRMDGEDGIEACRAIRRKDPGIDVIILSAFDQLGHADRARDAGIAGWVSKDSAPDELLQAIGLVVADRTARQVLT